MLAQMQRYTLFGLQNTQSKQQKISKAMLTLSKFWSYSQQWQGIWLSHRALKAGSSRNPMNTATTSEPIPFRARGQTPTSSFGKLPLVITRISLVIMACKLFNRDGNILWKWVNGKYQKVSLWGVFLLYQRCMWLFAQ